MDDRTHLAGRCDLCGATLPHESTALLCEACQAASDSPTIMSGELSNSALARPGGPQLEAGQTFGDYRIGRLLGRGGMGEVHEAEHIASGRRVALKVLRGQLMTAADREQFLREGQLAASISHPHTVYIYGSEEIEAAPVISMELLPGGTLRDRVVAEGPLPPNVAVGAVLDIIGGLEAAHRAGILHRDIKPSNCFVDSDGSIKVGDFGLSISTLARDGPQAAGGRFQGTPQFAAPEQLRGRPLDVRADIYAVGATLYYLLTGQPPFTAKKMDELVDAVTSTPAPSPRSLVSAIPPRLAAVVQRCLAKTPDKRPATYRELAEALRPFSDRDDVPAPLGVRTLAGLGDAFVVTILSSLLEVWHRGHFRITAAAGDNTTTSLDIDPWTWLVGGAYFLILEGVWGRSLGKRLFGLRVTSAGAQPVWRQVFVRSLLYQVPNMVLATPLLIFGPSALGTWLATRPLLTLGLSLAPFLVLGVMFSSMRRRNGWATLYDLASRTRVVARHRSRARGVIVSTEEEGLRTRPAAQDQRYGPFTVAAELQHTGEGRLVEGFDAQLRRTVWIWIQPAQTAGLTAARRDVRRAGRLHWLAGGVVGDEQWDAFEAPDGRPLLQVPASSWHETAHVLSALTAELRACARDNTCPHLGIDRVWLREDGRALLLDFVAPGTDQTTETTGAAESPRRLLADVAGHLAPERRRHERPIPLSATAVLTSLAAGGAAPLDDVESLLREASRSADHVPRFRRLMPLVPIIGPVVSILVASVVTLSAIRSFDTADNRQMLGLLASIEALEPANRQLAERHLASRYRATLADEDYWSQLLLQEFDSLEEQARALVTRYPADVPPLSDEERASLAPQLVGADAVYLSEIGTGMQRMAAMVLGVLSMVMVINAMVVTTVSALAVPGGVVLRALGFAVVRTDGRQVGRLRSLLRVWIGWSPVVLWWGSLGADPVTTLVAAELVTVGGFVVMLSLWCLGIAWLIVTPERGLHDRIAGTWLVPR